MEKQGSLGIKLTLLTCYNGYIKCNNWRRKMKKILMVICMLMLMVMMGCKSNDKVEETVQPETELETEMETIPELVVDTESNSETEITSEDEGEIFEPIQMDDEKEYDVIDTSVLMNITDKNMLGDTGEKYQIVYLPPSYYDTDKDYPVIYYFHGHSRSPASYDYHVKKARELMMIGEMEEVIVVAVNSTNLLQGAYFANSPVIGNWKDAFLDEVMPHIENNYRTINTKEGRALLGFSMGGNSVMYLAFNYPELFGGVYAVAPSFVKDEHINEVVETWSTFEQRAYAAAFSYNVEEDPAYIVPTFDKSDEDQVIVDQWLKGIGLIDEKIDAYANKEEKVNRIGLEVASNDEHYWLIEGVTYLSETLSDNGIENQFEVTLTGHAMILPSVINTALPFLLEGLTDAH